MRAKSRAGLIFLLVSAVVAAVQTFGIKEEALNALLGTAERNPMAPDNNNNANAIPSGSMLDHASEEGEGEGDAGGPSSANKEDDEQRDLEMEDELADDLRNGDAFSDYDIEVTKEGEAINEYLALLASAHKK